MNETSARLVALTVLIIFVGIAWHFAAEQSLWIDETTQLLGLGLPFQAQLEWLMGGANPIPGVPQDRMPPLSYWLGSIWTTVFGISELSLRLMGIIACLSAAPALWLAARELEARNSWPAVFVIGLVYLSPGLITEAVEIRAYPLFFTCAAWSCWAFVRALEKPEPRRLAILSLFCLAAIYTHFFGIVMAGLLWFTLLLANWRLPRLIIIVGLVTLLLSGGLYPFVIAAMQVTGEVTPDAIDLEATFRDTLRLAFRLMFHGSHLASPVLLLIAVIAVIGLTLLALAEWRKGKAWLFLPLALALLALPTIKLFVTGFDVLAPHYNLWLVPLFALALVPVFRPGRRQPVGLGLAGMLLASHLAADRLLLQQPALFTHGPADWVAKAIEEPSRTVVVHDGSGDWPTSYFALFYRFDGQLSQILREQGKPDRQILPGEPLRPVVSNFVDDFETVIYLRATAWTSKQLAELSHGRVDCAIPPMLEYVPSKTRCAYSSASMQIIQNPSRP